MAFRAERIPWLCFVCLPNCDRSSESGFSSCISIISFAERKRTKTNFSCPGLRGQLGLEFVSDRADVAGEARRNGWNLEDAARRLRYQFFASAAASRGLNRVAVAHTADDQAETVLAHLLRGTGLAGLAGIYPVAGLIIRPLLEIGRDELRDYLSGLGQSWREDATNQDTSRMRARIRHQLLPLLRAGFRTFGRCAPGAPGRSRARGGNLLAGARR